MSITSSIECAVAIEIGLVEQRGQAGQPIGLTTIDHAVVVGIQAQEGRMGVGEGNAGASRADRVVIALSLIHI